MLSCITLHYFITQVVTEQKEKAFFQPASFKDGAAVPCDLRKSSVLLARMTGG